MGNFHPLKVVGRGSETTSSGWKFQVLNLALEVRAQIFENG